MRPYFLFFILIGLVGCASTKNIVSNEINPVFITNTKKFYLLTPEEIDKDISSYVQLEGQFGANSFSLQAYIEGNNEGLFLSLFNDFGTNMGTLVYDGQKVSFDSHIFPKALKPEYIATDLQFAYYKTSSIRHVLKDIGMTIEEDSSKRRIFNGNKLIEEVIRTDNSIKIINHLRGYEYNLIEAQE